MGGGAIRRAAIWDGWPIGTRLWTCGGTRSRSGAPRRHRGADPEQYIREAIQPFLDRRIGRECLSRQHALTGRIDAFVRIYRGPESRSSFAVNSLGRLIAEGGGYDIGQATSPHWAILVRAVPCNT